MQTLAPTPENLSKIRIAAGDAFELLCADAVAGAAELMQLGGCTVLTRIERDDERTECVVLAAQGKNLRHTARMIRTLATNIGCDSVRLHTPFRGIARLLSEQRPQFLEYVYRVELNHG